jgi:ketosteroid isomerase-like protein
MPPARPATPTAVPTSAGASAPVASGAASSPAAARGSGADAGTVVAAAAPAVVATAAAPAATSAPTAAPPATPEIEAFFNTFVNSYEAGRLDAFAALFDDDAETNLRRGRAAIRGEYDELFRLSSWRQMRLTKMNWKRSGDRAYAKGEIAVRIGWRDGREVEQRVAVDMEIIRRDGRTMIARLTHHATN